MATSGTVGQTSIQVDYIMDTVARRCGKPPSSLSPEDIELIKNTLFMMLCDWSTRGLNLWRLQRPMVGLIPGKATYVLDTGTIDVLNAVFRTPQRLTATATSSAGGSAASVNDGDLSTILTQVSPLGNVSFDLGTASRVNLVGILPGATAALTLELEYSDDGVTWSTAKSLAAATYTDNVWAWVELDPSYSAQYFRVRSTSGTLVLREVYLCQDWYDVDMYRMNKDEYSQLPNKRQLQEQVYQYWLDRQTTPQMVLWPTPSNAFYIMALQVHMHIQDVGTMAATLDLPQRWLDACCWCLALKVLPELPGADLTRFQMLKDMAAEPRFDAEVEERDKSPVRLVPGIGVYTR